MPHTTQQSYLLRIAAAAGDDGIRSMRRFLKALARRYALRCTEIRPDDWRSSERINPNPRQTKGSIMDMRQYAGTTFIRFDDVRDGPIRGKIREVKPGQYGRPVATLESGEQLTLNMTNTSTLIRAWGSDSRDWVGHTLEAYAGRTKYMGADQDSVLVRPLSAAVQKPRAQDPMNDEIPF